MPVEIITITVTASPNFMLSPASSGPKMTIPTEGLVDPVIKPGPVLPNVPPPVLSRASEMKTNDVRVVVPTPITITASPTFMLSSVTSRVRKTIPTEGLAPAVVKPGPVFSYVPPPVLSRASEVKTNDVRAVTTMTVPTEGLVHPVIKPGPVLPFVPSVVLSRASEANTNDVRAVTDVPTTFFTGFPYIFDNPGPIITVLTPATDPTGHSYVARDDPTPVITNPSGAMPTGDEQLSRKGNVAATTIGWIVAVTFACVMTACAVWLVLRKNPGRLRRMRYAIRRSQSQGTQTQNQAQGTQLLPGGSQGGPPAYQRVGE